MLQWPPGNGVSVSLVARIGPGRFGPRYIFPQVYRRSLPGRELYDSYVFYNDLSVESDDRQGRLRIARRSNVFATYYWKRERWIKIDSTRLPGVANISFDAITEPTTFGRVDVTVAFDSFTLFATQADCS